MNIAHTFILQFFLNTLFMNKVGECYLPSRMRKQYVSIIFNEKSAHYTDKILLLKNNKNFQLWGGGGSTSNK